MDVTSLLKLARSEGNPVIHGDTATFLWRGASAPQLVGDFDDWGARPVALRGVQPGVWAHSLSLPRDAYMEYAWVRGKRRVKDALNPRLVSNGLGGFNHFFYMPEAAPTPLVRRQRGVPQGRLSRHVLETEELAASARRAVHLYAPPTQEACPLLVVLDGPDYLRRARLTVMVENLVAQGRMRPVAMAFVAHGGRARLTEYACSDATLLFLVEKVVPLAQAHLRLLEVKAQPGVHGILGASAGGLMALYAGLRRPDVFGHVLSQSGAFAFHGQDTACFELVHHGPVRPVRLWLDCGRYEWLRAGNERMHALLAARGYDATYHEYNAGHSYPAWRDDVWRGLEHLYGDGA